MWDSVGQNVPKYADYYDLGVWLSKIIEKAFACFIEYSILGVKRSLNFIVSMAMKLRRED